MEKVSVVSMMSMGKVSMGKDNTRMGVGRMSKGCIGWEGEGA